MRRGLLLSQQRAIAGGVRQPSAARVATAAAGARSLAPLMKNMKTSRGRRRRRRRPRPAAARRARRRRASPRALGPGGERLRRDSRSRTAGSRAHQARVDEVAGDIGERRVVVGVGEHRRDAVAARQREVLRRHEARVAHLHRVAQRQSRRRSPAAASRKALEVVGIERLVVANCQTIGPSFGPSSARPLATKRSIDSPASPSTRRLVA